MWSIRRNLLGGAVIAFVLAGGFGGWAATTELSGAVIAAGSVVVDTPAEAKVSPQDIDQLYIGPGRGYAVLSLQPAHDTRDQRHDQPDFG